MQILPIMDNKETVKEARCLNILTIYQLQYFKALQIPMRIKLVITLLLFLLTSAQLHHQKRLITTLLSPVYLNADNQENIIVGGTKGQIEIFSSAKLKTSSKVFKGVCQSKIVLIEWLQFKGYKQFVVVDSLGCISVWKRGSWEEVQNISLNKRTISAASKLEDSIEDTRLALNAGDQIIQISFSPLKVVKRWSINLQININQLQYAGNDLVALGDDFNIYVHQDSSNQLSVIPLSYGSFEFLHILEIDNQNHVVGIANTNLQVSFPLSGLSRHQTRQITNQKIISFKMSQTKRRKGSQRFLHQQPYFLIGLSDNNFQIRSLTDFIQAIRLDKSLNSVQFYDDEIIILFENEIEVIQLDHEVHSQIRYAGFAFLPLTIVVIVLAFWKNSQQRSRKQKEKAANIQEIQLQQMLISNNMKKEQLAY